MYTHSESSAAILVAMGVTALFFGLLLLLPGVWSGPAALIIAGALLFLGVVAYHMRSLTCRVSPEGVSVWFGSGLFRRTVAIADIKGARITRYPWYYGIGLRFIPRGWLYNVRGMTAVELELRGGRRQRCAERRIANLPISQNPPFALHELVHGEGDEVVFAEAKGFIGVSTRISRVRRYTPYAIWRLSSRCSSPTPSRSAGRMPRPSSTS